MEGPGWERQLRHVQEVICNLHSRELHLDVARPTSAPNSTRPSSMSAQDTCKELRRMLFQ
eukprot:3439925-Rhodomonas_salina.3